MQDFGSKRTLVVERFDRVWTRDGRLLRRPQEDCCQALSISPTRKYESDGGPGIAAVLSLLKGSDVPDEDQAQFLKSLVVFWLLGATDGHAKNFSIFLSPGGRFRLTPLYDVISTQPSADAGQIRRNQMKMAMAVGDTRHYVVDTIVPRHFVQTATRAGVATSIVEKVFHDIADATPGTIELVRSTLPPGFPEQIATSIIMGFESRLRTFVS